MFWREIVEERDGAARVSDLGSVDAIVRNDAVVLEQVHGVDLVVALGVNVVL